MTRLRRSIFGLIEPRHHAPLVPLRIFRSRTLASADAVTVLIGTVAVGMPFVLTLYARQVLGYSALKFGVSSVVLAVGATTGAIAGQAAVLKAGFRSVAATGMALALLLPGRPPKAAGELPEPVLATSAGD